MASQEQLIEAWKSGGRVSYTQASTDGHSQVAISPASTAFTTAAFIRA